MNLVGRIVRFDGLPTVGARIVVITLVLTAFLAGFAARSRGQEGAADRPAAATLMEQLAGDGTGTVAAPRARLAAASALPGPAGGPARRRARKAPAAAEPPAMPVATPAPEQTPEATPTPTTPAATPPTPVVAPVSPPAPARTPAPPSDTFDSSG